MSDIPRLDKWLWHARLCKTRTLAARICAGGRVRVNGTPVAKAHHALKPGDVLTLPLGTRICVVRVRAIGLRRGPASEARLLYDDLSPAIDGHPGGQPGASADREPQPAPAAERPAGMGRPTKAERRALEKLRDRD